MMKKGEERFMDIYQSVVLESKKTFKRPSPNNPFSSNYKQKLNSKDVFDFAIEEVPESGDIKQIVK